MGAPGHRAVLIEIKPDGGMLVKSSPIPRTIVALARGHAAVGPAQGSAVAAEVQARETTGGQSIQDRTELLPVRDLWEDWRAGGRVRRQVGQIVGCRVVGDEDRAPGQDGKTARTAAGGQVSGRPGTILVEFHCRRPYCRGLQQGQRRRRLRVGDRRSSCLRRVADRRRRSCLRRGPSLHSLRRKDIRQARDEQRAGLRPRLQVVEIGPAGAPSRPIIRGGVEKVFSGESRAGLSSPSCTSLDE